MVSEYLHYKAKVKDSIDFEESEELLLKSKNYYFEDNLDTIIEDFLKENKERGYEVDKSDIIVYRYYIP